MASSMSESRTSFWMKASSLNDVYPEDTYRIGGDEFVVLVPDVEESIFDERVRMLQDEMQEQDISISLGALWQEQCDDLDGLLKEADRRMYAEKTLHYQKHPRRNVGDKDADPV